MKILIDMGHPAHVHFFRNAIRELEAQGHSVKVTARDKDVTLRLLDAYKIPYDVRPDGWRPMNLLKAGRFLARAARAFGADRLAGVHNPYVARAAATLGKPCVLFTDTPGSDMVNRLSVLKASNVVTPECLAGRFPRQATYPGYKEMAYLHPIRFEPDSGVLAKYGIPPGEKYYIVRLISWDAYHDSGIRAMAEADKKALLARLSSLGRVIACFERKCPVPEGVMTVRDPADIHSLLAHSAGYVGEGATMAKEAAVLGVPSVYVSPLSGLPPIIEMERAGALMRINALDLDAVDRALAARPARMEMHDVTGAVVGNVLG